MAGGCRTDDDPLIMPCRPHVRKRQTLKWYTLHARDTSVNIILNSPELRTSKIERNRYRVLFLFLHQQAPESAAGPKAAQPGIAESFAVTPSPWHDMLSDPPRSWKNNFSCRPMLLSLGVEYISYPPFGAQKSQALMIGDSCTAASGESCGFKTT